MLVIVVFVVACDIRLIQVNAALADVGALPFYLGQPRLVVLVHELCGALVFVVDGVEAVEHQSAHTLRLVDALGMSIYSCHGDGNAYCKNNFHTILI